MSCRVAHLRMEWDCLIKLPHSRRKHFKRRKNVRRTLSAEQRPEILKKAGEFDLEFELVGKSHSALWNEYIDRYHYLGFTPLFRFIERMSAKIPNYGRRGTSENAYVTKRDDS